MLRKLEEARASYQSKIFMNLLKTKINRDKIYLLYSTLSSPPKRSTLSKICGGLGNGNFYFLKLYILFTTFLQKEQQESRLIIMASQIKKKNKKYKKI